MKSFLTLKPLNYSFKEKSFFVSNNTHEKITRFWLAEKGVQNV